MGLFVTAIVTLLLALPLCAQRVVLSLDGTWQVADSLTPEPPAPGAFTHRAPVPGLANLAEPPFPDVDRFDSIEVITNKIRQKLLPASAAVEGVGASRQNRNWFWYRTTFRPRARKAVARLRINKAQFGTAVWLNGKQAGDYPGCFSASHFDITGAIRWDGDNELIVRIGAHPGVLPPSMPAGTDQEKNYWTPGIYDSVSVAFADNPVIESVQVAPRIAGPEILIETRLHNYGAARSVRLSHRVGAQSVGGEVRLAAGESKAVTHTLKLPGAALWTPEKPNLHTLATSTGGDSLTTRFGIREFRFDSTTKRAWLNGKPYFLRGSNVTLHRFFEDPNCKRLPWDEAWVRKLLVDIPKKFHWNAFRFCIGPVPDKWLDIADEAGLLIQNEYFVWKYRPEWDTKEMIRQYSDWMRDNWNHPSVAIWDAQNETRADVIADIIRAVRPLDLSRRPWDNGYELPADPNDPVEDHPYLFSRIGNGFEIPELERMTGAKSTNSPHPSAHAVILNEYGWLWLNRDGSPTPLTKRVYDRIAPNSTAGQRFELNAYYLGGLTEFWRAHRNFAGVLHFVYLMSSFPDAFTSDHFRDVTKLELEPRFVDYMTEAFKPLGVYLNFWRAKLPQSSQQRFAVMMINDEYEGARGTLRLTLSAGGRELARAEKPFEVPALGQQSYTLDLKLPAYQGECLLTAEGGGTKSRRKVVLQ
jgi:beta-galactosidase